MTNKKRLTISILCLLMLIVSMLAFSACGGKVENFNLSFKVDGENYSTISTNGSEVVAIPENPIKEGYTFDGWYWDKDVWSKPFTANSLMDAPISSDMSVYAKFSAIKYDITYENDGGTHNNPVSYTIEDSFALSAAERPGYTFVGWYSDSTYTSKVESVSAGSKGAITLYAKFEINNYTISYGNTKDAVNNNVTSYNVNTDTITLSDLSKTGYVFEGWYNGEEKVTEIAKGSTGDITLTAKWSVIGYDITYHNVDGATNSNSATYDVEDQPLALSDASKDGYRFLGWYTDAAFTNKVSEIAIGTTGDINLYAKWELIGYTATFMDGTTVVESIKFTVESESITEPAVPNHLGYTGAWESYTLGTENITVNAVYTLISYGITYNNVSGATNNNPATYDVEDQPLTLVDASKDYYTFLGWYSDAALTNRVTEISVGTTGDVALYAKWEAIEYTATFMDGDTEVGTVKFTVESESITEPAVPEHVGYTGAWESYSLGTENITVNAVYTLISYGITYNNVSGATNNNPTTYNVEAQPLALVDASKAHYTFLGWYSDAEFNNEVTEISVGATGPVVLYAKWEAIEYTATFMDGNTEVGKVKFTVESESITEPAVPNHTGYTGAWENYTLGTGDITIKAVYSLVTYGITYNNVSGATNSNPTTYNVEDQPLALVDASKAHYTFLGWYSDAEFNNEVTEISVGTTGPVMLYAKWEAVEYTITFLYDNAIGDYAEGTVVKTTYTVEDEFEFATLVSKTVGYTFNGWYTEKNVGTGTKVTGVTKGTSGNITVYAQFGLEEYDITYNNVNGATNNNVTYYTVESEDFTIYPLTKEGYTFDGWFTNEECTTPANLTITKGSSGDITLYAKWTPITYTIEYVTYGGTATGNPATYIITDNVTFNNATLSGYVFKGWYTESEGGKKITGITSGTTGNIVLYAHWDYVSTITFESNGGSPVNSISNVEGTAISAPTAPTKEHYTFAGWYSDAALKNAYSFETQPAEDITLYAKWTPVVYEIEYVLSGGTNSENNVFEYTVEDKIELHAPSKVGYTFIGWFTDAEFTSSVVTELKVGTSGKITLYAHYSVNQYTISFESNGGTSVAPITQNYATSVTAPEAPSKNGYTFAGWYSNASLTRKYTFSTMPADNITLYAKWNLETYNIIYNLNGGTNNSGNPKTYTITSAKITLKAPTKNGYSFAGWYTDAECTEAITEIASGSYGVVELFAKWTATEYTITYVTADGATHSNILTYTIETDLTTLADAALKGHAFGGWYTNSSYITAVTTVAGGEIGNKTIYAKFTANTYNVWLDGNEEASCVVSFNLNGAEGEVASQTVTPTATLKYPTAPTRDGYIFAGWYKNENCTGALYDFTSVVTSDTTLYAKWVKVENATAIAINGSSNVTLNGKYEQMLMFVPLVSGNITITASGSYDTFGVLYNSEMVALAQDDDNASDAVNFLIVYNVTAGETYYIGARAFSSTTTGIATVSISGETTVSDGGYAITASKGSATYGQNFTLNVPNARDGYKFLGYADENGVMYTDANGNSVKTWDKDEETTLYSEWERTVYTVTFVTSGGTPIDSIELAYGERLDIGKYVTTRSGYSFNGWYLDGAEFNATTMPDHNITLTAYWKTFALGSIKYDVDKLAISVDDEITADLFSAICLDTNGNLATFTVTVSGTQAAGETISVRLVATSGNKTKQITITGIKVYGAPTLNFDNTVDYFNIKDGLTASWFGASGVDSFGNATAIRVYVDYDYEAGKYVTVTIESIDPAGNKTYGCVENVKAYGLPKITYNENKTSISVNDTLNAGLFGATAKDSFEEPLTVTVSKYSGTIAAGNTVTIRISATDSKGNVTNIDVLCKVYGAPTISSATKTDVKLSDMITPELLDITANDTYGQTLDVILTVKNGTQTAGTTMTVTATVTDIAGNVATKNYTLKVYGTPTITYGKDAIKVTDNVEANVSILNAVATDSFGNSLTVTAKLNGTLAKGNYVTYTLTAIDRLGNIATLVTEAIGVYDVNDISLTYSAGMSDLIKLTSKGEEFDAKATDSFGNACDITIEATQGYTFAGGQIISIYIVATDKAGNKVYSDIIENIKVYDMPTVETPDVIHESTDINFIAIVKDSFGEELYAEITWTGTQKAGEYVYVTIKAEDDAGNIIENTYTYRVVPDGYVHTLKADGTYELTSYTGTDSEVEVWSMLNGKAVTSIAANAFKNNTHITSVKIPASVTSIGYSTFSGCSSLESITLPFVGASKDGTSNTHFGYIFGASGYDSNSSCVPSSLKTVVITGGTRIGSYTFRGCKSLTSVRIPDSVTSIGDSAFSGCSSLENITIPFVGSSANATSASSSTLFGYIFGSVSYEGGVSTIQYYSSSSCSTYYIPSNLKSVTVTGGEIHYGAFYGCTSLTSVAIGNSVTSIGFYAFYNCTSLTSVAIGNSVTSIGFYAFGCCSNLTSVVIPDSVTSIGESAFYNCFSLECITLPFVGASKDGTSNTHFDYIFGSNSPCVPSNLKTVVITGGTSIGFYAFSNCDSLTSITIPDSVTSIGYCAFYNCTSLKYNGYNNAYYLGNENNPYLVLVSAKDKYITSVTIHENTSVISYEAFYNCTSLTSITIPNSVTSIGDQAFNNCTSLTSITIPNSVTSIGDHAFNNCTSLTSVTIPDSVTSIGSWAFYNCTSLKYNGYNNAYYLGNENNPYLVLVSAKDTYITSVTIHENTSVIYSEAFYNCASLTSITIPNSVTSIGYRAFYNCTSLTSVAIGNSVTSIGSRAFYNCTSIESITLPFVGASKDGTSNTHFGYIFGASGYDSNSSYVPSSLKTVVITSGTSIGSYAFYNCTSLTSITIPNSVTSIGDHAFRHCTSLECITLPFVGATKDDASNTHFGYIFGASNYSNSSYVPSSLKTVVITGASSIGDRAFYNCTSLTSVTIPDSVTSIGSSAFYNCTSLTSVTIPDSVTSIGSSAFSNCSSLVSVSFGENSQLTNIGSNAFYNCTSLVSVSFGENSQLTNIGSNAFYNCTSLTSVTIPDSVTSIGSSAFYNCTSLTSIVFSDTSTWYRTTSSSNWNNKTGGTSTNVTNSSTNATDFKSTHSYWYKL